MFAFLGLSEIFELFFSGKYLLKIKFYCKKESYYTYFVVPVKFLDVLFPDFRIIGSLRRFWRQSGRSSLCIKTQSIHTNRHRKVHITLTTPSYPSLTLTLPHLQILSWMNTYAVFLKTQPSRSFSEAFKTSFSFLIKPGKFDKSIQGFTGTPCIHLDSKRKSA